MNSRTIETVTAYIHPDAPEGWSYSVRYDDGHEESGTLDTDDSEAGADVVYELEQVVAAWGGDYAAGDLKHHEHHGGFYAWTAA